MGWHQILSLLCCLFFLHSPLSCASTPCPVDQRDALLHFKNSFLPDCAALDSVCEYDGIPSYPKANSWNKGRDCCSWDGVMCDNVTGNVISLDLRCNCIHGALDADSSLFLPLLEVLRLSSCNLTKIPYFLNSLKRLTHLDLSYCKRHVTPFAHIRGPRRGRGRSAIPPPRAPSLGLLHSPPLRAQRPRCGPTRGQESALIPIVRTLIGGEIPSWFWRISHDTLETLDLSHNLLEGGIQQFHWKRLSYICLQNNSFQGPLPIPPPSTSYFDASNNAFTDLSNNNLFGNMPSCFGNITILTHLNLSSNKLQGSIPRSLVKCVHLLLLDLGHNEFSDIFPHWLEAPHLVHLHLRSNKFHEFFLNTSLGAIDLSNNNFEGPIPLPSPVTNYYSIASNNIIGKIPSLICNATRLEIIDLSNNGISGSLPWCLVNFSTVLSILNLRINLLEGTIPQSFSSRNRLMTLDLSRNQFEGTLPRSLVQCKHLEVLNLGENQIEDTFLRWLGTLPKLKLRILDLSNNNFSGPLPANLIMNLKGMMNGENEQDKSLYMTQFFRMSSYENSVTVTMKGLEIELVKILTIFTTIDLSHNSFQGDIPRVIGHLHSLKGLNLAHNRLTGSIPLTLGNLTNLEWLDLSSNKLIGGIPRKLRDLTFLAYLNLSKNQLIGRIPQDKQLGTFSSDSFSKNPGLCGAPLPKACLEDVQAPPPSSSSTFDGEAHESWFNQKVVWIGYASGTIIGISIAYIVFEMGRPKWLARDHFEMSFCLMSSHFFLGTIVYQLN
ncbi:hypothetical protein BT93_L3080 [Corymbia citriodora subsp. variegata]|uniref:Leucine-rich repeat-containing N-terminal plant-type domain-containing protein n=1 Tax=Corymbia citriodora subsp. variegata TaxID=360336 RepID=A0A8T0CHW9_CORYI|nr:hypothetical protein BT93_L3080 [Corymbia citriodora subsp. variegata]